MQQVFPKREAPLKAMLHVKCPLTKRLKRYVKVLQGFHKSLLGDHRLVCGVVLANLFVPIALHRELRPVDEDCQCLVVEEQIVLRWSEIGVVLAGHGRGQDR